MAGGMTAAWPTKKAASLLGVTPQRVGRWIDVERVIRPELVGGDRMITRRDLVRLAVLLELQRVLGQHSPWPVKVARELPEEIAGCLDRRDLEDPVTTVIQFTVNGDTIIIRSGMLNVLRERILEHR